VRSKLSAEGLIPECPWSKDNPILKMRKLRLIESSKTGPSFSPGTIFYKVTDRQADIIHIIHKAPHLAANLGPFAPQSQLTLLPQGRE
jgi:hypothetical protein